MPTHETVQGECFATIARDNGFSRDELYNHPDNGELRKIRPNPNVLHPGDVVSIPDRRPKTVTKSVEMRHRFVTKLPMRELRVKLLDGRGEPIAGETYALELGSELRNGRTDGAGLLVETFRGRQNNATLVIQGRRITLAFGEVNPLKDAPDEGASGGRERLRNLGYDVGEDASDDVDENGLDGGTRTATALFQHHAQLPVTGDLDDATMAKLSAVHGC